MDIRYWLATQRSHPEPSSTRAALQRTIPLARAERRSLGWRRLLGTWV